jgi:acyl carrier protein
MINRESFITKVADLFDETDPSEITLDSNFRDLDEWGSLIGMGLMAITSDEYEVNITPEDLQKVHTFEELAQLIDEKKK